MLLNILIISSPKGSLPLENKKPGLPENERLLLKGQIISDQKENFKKNQKMNTTQVSGLTL